MSPKEASELQIQLYRQMTGEQRLAIALRLHALACDLAREGIRHQHPQATDEEVEALLRERLLLGSPSGVKHREILLEVSESLPKSRS